MKLSAKVLILMAGVQVISFLLSYLMVRHNMPDLSWYLLSEVTRGVLSLALLWVLLELVLVRRLIRFIRELGRIVQENVFSKRVVVSGSDELSEMTRLVNSLFDIIETSEEELKLRIAHRSDRLEHLSDLNKNLFSEINRQRGIGEKLREQEKNLRRFAYYDQLTGLPNRMFFREQVKKLIERAAKSGVGLVVMFLDTDRFKLINDTYGHPIGDQFLCHIATRLKSVIKDSDMVARYAGDEFVIFLNNVREKSIVDFMAEKILKSVSTPLDIEGGVQIVTSFSLGISLYPEHGKTIEELEHSADLAMYHAKKQQGNAYCYAGTTETVSATTV